MFQKVLFCLIIFVFCTLSIATAQKPGKLPDNVDTSDCTVTPPAKSFDIKLKWESKEYFGVEDPHINGCSTPLVADMDGDGYPEIIGVHTTINAGHGDTPKPNSFISRDLCVLNGKTGEFKYMVKTAYFQLHGQPVALGDVDGDGAAEIFMVSDDFHVYCYKGNQANASANDYKWMGHTSSGSNIRLDYQFIPMLADLNNDGIAELVCGGHVFNALTGVCLVEGETVVTGRGFGSPHNVRGGWQLRKQDLGYEYYINAVADMDGDNQLELCAGNTIYKFNITNIAGSNGNYMSILRQCENILPYDDMYDGQTVVLDFDNDGDLDVCVFGRRTNQLESGDFSGGRNHIGVYVWEGCSNDDTPGDETSIIGYYACDNKTFSFSVPFAGDLNGDGYPELVVNSYIKGYHWNKDLRYTDQIHIFTFAEGHTENSNVKAFNIKEMFSESQSKEYASHSGFTVFDFNQDTKSEIVYRDHGVLYILDGSTLEKLCDPVTCYSGNTAEYPIVADVDCDGHADIIVTSQYIYADGLIEHSDNDLCAGKIQVFESETPAAWGPARKIWNQWAYNVVGINEDGTIPQYQFDVSTKFPNGHRPFNAFLQQATMLNSNGDMFLPAPDAEAIFEDSVTFQNLCDEFVIDLAYTNSGSLMLNAPYGISVYKDDRSNSPLRTVRKNDPLNPGDTVRVRIAFSRNEIENLLPIEKFIVSVNDMGTGPGESGGQQQECDIENNILSHDYTGLRTSIEVENPVIVCDGASYEIGEHVYTQSGDYVDTLVNAFGCDSIVHTHLHLSAIEFDFATTRYCSEDLPVTLDASGSGATGYQWSTGDTTASIQAMVSDGGTDDIWEYYVIVYNEDGCLDTSNLVTIYRNPVVEITTEPDTSQFCTIGEATFTAAAVNINATEDVTWLWDNGETSTSILLNTTHELTPWVEATFHECTGRDSIYVPECPCSVKFFNTLTPNGDGFNDTFAPVLEATFNYYKLVIYNRWGECVFKSKDPSESWDGTINGQEASEGTYYYVFTYACMSAPEEKVSRHGSVTLVR